MEEVATLHQKEIADKQPVGLEPQWLRRIKMKTDDDDEDNEDLVFFLWPLVMMTMAMTVVMTMMMMMKRHVFSGRWR